MRVVAATPRSPEFAVGIRPPEAKPPTLRVVPANFGTLRDTRVLDIGHALNERFLAVTPPVQELLGSNSRLQARASVHARGR